MRISYPEAERMGWNYEDVYLFAFSELDYLTTELQKLYNNDGINRADGKEIEIRNPDELED